MWYINIEKNSNGAYGAPQSNYVSGRATISDEFAAILVQHNGFVTLTVEEPDPESENGSAVPTVTACEPDTDNWESWKSAQPDPLVAAKEERIQKSKDDLAAYLLSHPLAWTDGEQYAITAEKQQQLTSKIMSATMAQTMSTDYHLTWNSTGAVCKEWTLPDLTSLAFAIDRRVTALVTYQQTQEVAMQAAQTMEELEAVVVDYDSVGVSS